MSHFKVVFGFCCIINLVTSFFHSYESQFKHNANEHNETVDTFDTTLRRKWIEQPLDHFNPKDNRTFKMRYYEKTNLWKEGKPIYLVMLHLSNALELFYEGQVLELAEDTNGALFTVDYRYYGDSNPFEVYTTERMKFLNTRQILADVANLLKYLKSLKKFESSKVVVVGAGYGGNLAAWMRLVYPDLVDAAYASSAAVLAKVDFYEYLEKVSDDFKRYGSPGCWDKIAEKFAYYEKAFQTKEGIEALKKEEHVCEECDLNKHYNKVYFFDLMTSDIAGVAEYAMRTRDFKEYCDIHLSLKQKNKVLRQSLNAENGYCYIIDIDEVVKLEDKLMLSLTYQSCTEFGNFVTSASDKPFTKNLSIDYYYYWCEVLFGPDMNATRVKNGVEETNMLYGGLKPNVTKVVFVTGELDPWSKLYVVEDLSPEAPAIRIPEVARYRDLYPEYPKDSEQLKQARTRIKSLIKSWIGEGE